LIVVAQSILEKSRNVYDTGRLWQIRDSLDSIIIPLPSINSFPGETIITVKNQEDWDRLGLNITKLLKEGIKNLRINITIKRLEYGKVPLVLENMNCEDVNIFIDGDNVVMIPWGDVISRTDKRAIKRSSSYLIPYSGFEFDNIILDQHNKDIPLYGELKALTSSVEEVKDSGKEIYINSDGTVYKTLPKLWRFPVDLPDLTKEECKDFFLLLTRDWTACRHKVHEVKDGKLYFYLRSDDAPTLGQMTLNPNKDWQTHHVRPYYRFVNCPVSKDLYFSNAFVHVPNKYKEIRIGKGSRLVVLNKCKFNSFVFNEFHIVGGGRCPAFEYRNCSFIEGSFITKNRFENMSSLVLSAINCQNVCFSHNTVTDTRTSVISCYGCINTTIWANRLSRIGWMLSTRAVSIRGKGTHIVENTIEDFNYSAIECGTHRANRENGIQNYIIERNVIRYSDSFRKKNLLPILSDAGGIYICPQNTCGIIRHNVVVSITGKGANRGIFLDDGAKNMAIYGNLIMNTDNSYDIDLRRSNTYADGIPDHNTNNQVFHNIMTGGYRFQDTGKNDSRCIGGENLLLDIGDFKKRVVELKCSAPDYTIEGGKYKNGKVIIPKGYRGLLDSLRIDSFVRKYISLR